MISDDDDKGRIKKKSSEVEINWGVKGKKVFSVPAAARWWFDCEKRSHKKYHPLGA